MRVLLVALLTLFTLQPANAAPKYIFPVADCAVNYARAHHDYAATDILAKKGCKFVSPVNGVVDEVNRKDNWSGKTNLGIDRGADIALCGNLCNIRGARLLCACFYETLNDLTVDCIPRKFLTSRCILQLSAT